MRLLTPEQLAPPSMGRYSELSRVLLDCGASLSSAADNALLDYCLLANLPGSIEEQNFNATLGRLILAAASPDVSEAGSGSSELALPPDEIIQRALERYARELAFNEFFPQPAHLAAAAFEEAMKFELPELGPDGRPTGRTIPAELVDLPELLPGRPDAAELRSTLRKRLRALGAGNNRAYAAELAALTETLYLLPLTPLDPQEEPSPLPEQFRRQIAEIRAGLERREKIERELAETEIRLAPPEKFYGEAITEAQRPSPALPPEAQRFLEQVESRWIGD